MPCEMHGKSGAFDPCRLGSRKERQALAGAPLHLHDVYYNVNRTRMLGVDGERAPGRLFGTTILTVFLQRERVHRQDARVAGHRGVPFRQHLGDTIAHHASPPEAKVECMRDHERENVARPVDDDGAVTLERESGVTLQPRTRRDRVSACGVVDVRTRRLDDSDAHGKRGSLSGGIGTYDDCGTQTMTEHALRVVGKNPLNLDRGIAPMRHQQLKRMFASRLQIGIVFDGCGVCRVTFDCWVQLALPSALAVVRAYLGFCITPRLAGVAARWVPRARRQWIALPRASVPLLGTPTRRAPAER